MVFIEPEFEPAKISDSERYEGLNVDRNVFARKESRHIMQIMERRR